MPTMYSSKKRQAKELQGRPSFNNVLANVSKVYQENREKILNQAVQMKDVFRNINQKNRAKISIWTKKRKIRKINKKTK